MVDIDPQHIAKLSPELIELIVTAIIDGYGEDPATRWIKGRRLSGFHLRRIERESYDQWLPQMCITLYIPPWLSTDYQFRPKESMTPDLLPLCVRFRRSRPQPHVAINCTVAEIKAAWDRYDKWNPNAHIQLGQQLPHGLSGNDPMVNDSELVGLCVSATGQEITFDWRKTLTAFFEEEFVVRRIRAKAIAAGCSVATNYAWSAIQPGRIRDLAGRGSM